MRSLLVGIRGKKISRRLRCLRPLAVVVLAQLQHARLLLYTEVGRAMSVMSRSSERWRREMVSLMYLFVAMISDSTELREVRHCQRYFQERGPPHRVMMWPDMEQNL